MARDMPKIPPLHFRAKNPCIPSHPGRDVTGYYYTPVTFVTPTLWGMVPSRFVTNVTRCHADVTLVEKEP
jgi:hypothetical protein